MKATLRTHKGSLSKSFKFLTTIPPEIRNRIYEAAFDNARHAILISHTSASRRDGKPTNACSRLGSYDTALVNVSSVHLLRCCRQIYQEGMGVILKGTTAIFTNEGKYLSIRTREHLSFVRLWLQRIGPEISLLRKVIVDLSVNTYYRDTYHRKTNYRRYYSDCIDLLPWLNVITAPSQSVMQLEFTGSRPPPFNSSPLYRPPPAHVSIYPRLETIWSKQSGVAVQKQILKSIVERDTLNLRRFSDLDRRFSEITINDKGTEGKIKWHSIVGCPAPQVGFDILEDGRVLHKRHIQSTRNLLAFPQDVLGIICEHTVSVPRGIVADLDSKTSTLPVFPLLNLTMVHSRLLGAVVPSIYLSNTFAFIIRSHTKRTTSRFLSGFSRWLKMDAPGIPNTPTATGNLRTVLRWMKAVHFELRFNVPERTSLESLRISIVDFLQTTTWDEPFTATIKYALICHRKGGRTAHYETTFTLRYMQLNAFIILSHLLEAQPGRRNRRCPNVYINGFGVAVEITYPGKNKGPRFHNSFRDMSTPSRAGEKGKYYARWLKHLVPIDGGSQYHEKTDDELRPPGSLIRVWDDLRIALWGGGLRAAW